MTKPKTTPTVGAAEHEVAMTTDMPETALPPLPSANISHAAVYINETNVRLAGFEAGVLALNAEIEGQQEAFDAKIKELTEKHTADKAALLARVEDLQKAVRMAAAAIDAAQQ